MTWNPESKNWPEKRAVMFVHGIGNSSPGDYDELVENFKTAIGPDVANKFAYYFLYYDDINDQYAKKTDFVAGIQKIKDLIKEDTSPDANDDLSTAIADFAGDVIFPVLSEAARLNVRERYIAQLQKIRLDGKNVGVDYPDQKISIICHSMGCFHTYEALHAAAKHAPYRLLPITDDMKLANVIHMASPVQLVRSVASKLGRLVPKSELATLEGDKLTIPSEESLTGRIEYCTPNWVSITGDMDPVGGHIFNTLIEWAYMAIDLQDSRIQDQTLLNIRTIEDLLQILLEAMRDRSFSLPLNNPHSWDAYIEHYKGDLRTWLDA